MGTPKLIQNVTTVCVLSCTSLTLLSELLAPEPPLRPETVYHRLLSCELGQQSCLVFLEQLELHTQAPVLLHLCFQWMHSTLIHRQTGTQTRFYILVYILFLQKDRNLKQTLKANKFKSGLKPQRFDYVVWSVSHEPLLPPPKKLTNNDQLTGRWIFHFLISLKTVKI